MNKPKICPCTKEIERESFFIFIMILDVFTQGLGGFICGGLGLLIYCYTKTFNSIYFKIFSNGRLFIDIVIMIFIGILILRYLLGFKDISHYVKTFSNFIFIFLFLIVYYAWNIYLSYNFVIQVKIYQNKFKEHTKSEEEILLQDQSLN